MKPELNHYPCWLREQIFPTEPFSCVSRNDRIDTEKAMRHVFDNQRVEPSYRVVAMLTLEVIRYRFKNYEMQQSFRAEISDLETRVATLEKKNKKGRKAHL